MDDGRWWRRICCVRTYRCDYGWGCQLANYGEYSGAPSTEETFTYAKIMFILMTRHRHPDGKFLIIGGAIAKKTDVASTFTTVIKVLEDSVLEFKEHSIKMWIRRAGPNSLDGLCKMNAAGQRFGLSMKLYGPEIHIAAVVPVTMGCELVHLRHLFEKH